MDTATQGAFNYSGALRAPRQGPYRWLGKVIEAINAVPLPVSMAVAPDVALFSNFTLANVPEIALQHIPIVNLFAPRAQESFKAGMTRDAGFQAMRLRRLAETRVVEAAEKAKGMRKEMADLKKAARRLKEGDVAKEFLLEEATKMEADIQAVIADAKAAKAQVWQETAEPIADWKRLRKSGYYSKSQLMLEYAGTGMLLMAMMAVARMWREDDGTKPTEIVIGHNEDGTRKVVDISRVAGPLTVPAVLGDVLGRMLLHQMNPNKYPSVTGMLTGDEALREAFKAFGYRQDVRGGGIAGFIGGLFGEDPETMSKVLERTAGDLVRLYAGAGGWARDIVKGGQHLMFGAPTNYISPTTHKEAWKPISDEQGWGAAAGQTLNRVGETVWNQTKGELLQGARGDLPEAFDKLTGKKRAVNAGSSRWNPLTWFLTVREQSDLNQLLENVRGEDMSQLLPASSGVQWYDEIVNRRYSEGLREEGIFEIARDTNLTQPERYKRIVDRMKDINMAAHTEAKRYAMANDLRVPKGRELLEKERMRELGEGDIEMRGRQFLDIPYMSYDRQMDPMERQLYEQAQRELLEPPPDDGGLGVY
jgi:hypothetical protein